MAAKRAKAPKNGAKLGETLREKTDARVDTDAKIEAQSAPILEASKEGLAHLAESEKFDTVPRDELVALAKRLGHADPEAFVDGLTPDRRGPMIEMALAARTPPIDDRSTREGDNWTAAELPTTKFVDEANVALRRAIGAPLHPLVDTYDREVQAYTSRLLAFFRRREGLLERELESARAELLQARVAFARHFERQPGAAA